MGDLLRRGWPEGVQRAESLAKGLAVPQPISRKRRRRFADTGDTVDMERVRAGGLDRAWTRTVRRRVNSPAVVSVVVDGSVNAMQSADTLYWRGAAAWVITEQLQQAGYSVHVGMLDANFVHDSKQAPSLTAVDVKQPQARLDKSLLIAAIAHPAMIRTMLYSAILQHWPRVIKEGLGRADRGQAIDRTGAARPDARAVVVGQAVESQESAQRAITDALG